MFPVVWNGYLPCSYIRFRSTFLGLYMVQMIKNVFLNILFEELPPHLYMFMIFWIFNVKMSFSVIFLVFSFLSCLRGWCPSWTTYSSFEGKHYDCGQENLIWTILIWTMSNRYRTISNSKLVNQVTLLSRNNILTE